MQKHLATAPFVFHETYEVMSCVLLVVGFKEFTHLISAY